MFVGKNHRQAVDTHAETAVGRHAVAHGAQVILVERMALFVVGLIITSHFEEALLLVKWVIKFGKSVA